MNEVGKVHIVKLSTHQFLEGALLLSGCKLDSRWRVAGRVRRE